MKRLRQIILLLAATLTALVARMVTDGPKLLGALTAALTVVLLICALAVRRQGRTLQSGGSSETGPFDAR
jgi:phosphate starvation-inducible membrane PsiE